MHLCRAGVEDEWEEEARRAEEHREPSRAVWAAYWGYDSSGPGGILDRLYTALRIPQKSWGGLKRLPEVGGISYERRHNYMHLVSNFLQVRRPSSTFFNLCHHSSDSDHVKSPFSSWNMTES